MPPADQCSFLKGPAAVAGHDLPWPPLRSCACVTPKKTCPCRRAAIPLYPTCIAACTLTSICCRHRGAQPRCHGGGCSGRVRFIIWHQSLTLWLPSLHRPSVVFTAAQPAALLAPWPSALPPFLCITESSCCCSARPHVCPLALLTAPPNSLCAGPWRAARSSLCCSLEFHHQIRIVGRCHPVTSSSLLHVLLCSWWFAWICGVVVGARRRRGGGGSGMHGRCAAPQGFPSR